PDWTTVVAVLLVPLATVNGSQRLVETVLGTVPHYTAWEVELAGGCSAVELEFGTDPVAVRVTVPAGLDAPAQVLAPAVLAKNVYVTVPVAVIVSEVVSVAVSYADDP